MVLDISEARKWMDTFHCSGVGADVGMGIEFSGTIAGRMDTKEGFSEEVVCEKILMPG